MRTKPPLGVLMQVGQSLKTRSITELTDSTLRAFSSELDARMIRAASLEDCESLVCYAQRLRELTAAEKLTHVALVSIEPFDERQDEVSIIVLDITRGTRLAQLEAYPFGSVAIFEKGLSNFVAELAPQLVAAFPTGTIELSIDRPSIQVMLDGTLIGQTDGRTLKIDKVPAGEHRLSFSGEQINPSQVQIRVRENELVQTKIETVLRAQTGLKNMVVISGVVSSLVGAGLVAWSSYLESQQPEILCLSSSNPGTTACGAGTQFLRLGSDVSGVNPNNGSLAIAPLGYSLALTGSSLIGGGLWADDDNHLQMWAISSSILLGLITYGVSVSQEGQSGFDVP